MAGYIQLPADAWYTERDRITGKWPEVLVVADLRFWTDPLACSGRARPSFADLADTYGWTASKVKRLWYSKRWQVTSTKAKKAGLRADDRETTPDHRETAANQSRTNPPPTNADNTAPADQREPHPDHTRTTPGPHPDHTRTAPNSTRARSPLLSSTTTQQEEDADRDDGPAVLTTAALSVRTRKALAAAGLTDPRSVAALTASELRQRPGVGQKAVAEVVAWLADNRLQLRPEVAKPKPQGRPDVREVTTYWGNAFERTIGREWVWAGNDFHKTAHIVAGWLASSRVEQVKQAIDNYLLTERRGGVWPQDMPVSLAKMQRKGGVGHWLNHQPPRLHGEYQRPATKPRRGLEARTPEQIEEARRAYFDDDVEDDDAA